MAKKNYGLASGVGLFVDEETGLKILPGDVAQIDRAACGQRTALAIQHGGLIEVEAPKKGKDDKTGEGDKEPPK